MRKLPDNENMYTFTEASEMIGKSRSYVSLFLRRYEGDIPRREVAISQGMRAASRSWEKS